MNRTQEKRLLTKRDKTSGSHRSNVGRLHKGPVPSTSSEVPLQNKEREASKVGRGWKRLGGVWTGLEGVMVL